MNAERNKICADNPEGCWTCECGCITFDNKKCRLCGKSPKYGTIDYEELKTQILGGK